MKLVISLLLKISFIFSQKALANEDIVTFEETTILKRSLLLENSFSEQKFSEEKFKILKPQNIEAVVKMLPSFSVSEPYNNISGVFFRGADSEKILVIIDGVVMNDPTSPSGGFDYRFLQPSEIEEIRVWSPGESVSWGSGALGGIISIRTKRSSTRSFALSAGDSKTYQSGVHFGFQFGNWQSTFSYWGLVSEGISAASPSTGATELDGRNRMNIRMQASQQGDHSEQRIQFFHTQGGESTDRSGPVADDPNSGANFQSSVLSMTDQRNPSLISELISTVAVKKILRNDFDPSDIATATYSFGRTESNEIQARSQYLHQLTEDLKADVGFDYLDTFAAFQSADSTPSSSTFSKKSSQTGMFFRLHQQFEKAKLIPGFRLQLLNEGQANALTSLRYQWDFVGDYKFEYHAANGIKEPSLYQRFSSYGNSQLVSEKVEYHHIGFGKETATSKMLFLVFQQWYRDLVQFNLVTSKYENISSANIKGFEFQFSRDFGRVKLSFSGSEIYAQDGQGISLTRRPRQQVTLNTDHYLGRFQFAPLIIWKGQREDSATSGRVFLPSATLFDFGMKYYFNSEMILEGAIRNILGQELIEAYGYQGLGRRIEIGFRYFW